MPQFRLEFPEGFLDYEYEYTAKGYVSGVRILTAAGAAEVAFYEPARLFQDIGEELAGDGYLAFANLVVVPRIARDTIEQVVAELEAGGFAELTFKAHGGG
ncbi:MAG TPA: hypothetical protein VGM10_30910 [Actinocrinis sp.]|jgi:hypothetical protein